MSLQLEINMVHFEGKPRMCEKEEDVALKNKWTDDIKQTLYHGETKIHMIKLGPLSEEFLTRKKVGWSKVDFGLEFKVTEDNCYKWTSQLREDSDEIGPGLPIHYIYKLLDALKSVGYEGERQAYDYPARSSRDPVDKFIYTLVKKF